MDSMNIARGISSSNYITCGMSYEPFQNSGLGLGLGHLIGLGYFIGLGHFIGLWSWSGGHRNGWNFGCNSGYNLGPGFGYGLGLVFIIINNHPHQTIIKQSTSTFIIKQLASTIILICFSTSAIINNLHGWLKFIWSVMIKLLPLDVKKENSIKQIEIEKDENNGNIIEKEINKLIKKMIKLNKKTIVIIVINKEEKQDNDENNNWEDENIVNKESIIEKTKFNNNKTNNLDWWN
ncbi:hypothetical protein ACTA71_003467 [Dictyostelium dimigraforme]